jgi:MSHA biogenesis protein MshK
MAHPLFRYLMMTLVSLGSLQAYALQDPTRPPDADSQPVVASPAREIRLGSILLGKERRIAVIEGVALKEGDSHDNIRVRRIFKDRVEVTDRGQPRTLYPDPLPQVRRTP